MKKVANLVAMEMNSLISNPKFGFQKKAKAEKCCNACGKDCSCDSNCKCEGSCDSSCANCGTMEAKSFQEIFGIIIKSSAKLDGLGFDKAAVLLLKASEELMQEVADHHSAAEKEMDDLHEVESDPELKKLLDEIKERRADELGSEKDNSDENEIEDRNIEFDNLGFGDYDAPIDPLLMEHDLIKEDLRESRRENQVLDPDIVESNKRLRKFLRLRS